MGSMNKGTSTTTQQTQYPDWYQAAATGMTAPFMTPGKSMVAGMTEDQLMSGNLTRDLAQKQAGGTDYAGAIMSAGGAVSGDDIRDQMNPYLKDVGRTVLTDMRGEKNIANAQIGARNANSVAFGGSGAALERGQIERGYGQNVGRAITDIMSGGWDRASQMANANADRRMNAAVAAGSANSNQYNNQRQSIQDLMGYGTFTQAQAQQGLDIPYLAAQRYQSLVPGAQTSSQPITWNPLESLLGLGLGAAGIYRGFTK
jgi:hypothetical protein